ncbi:MAG: hypothetical protein J0H68_09275 [Sphingobacteriia bacterium]|nr:hypothetical protein [Sphingobacteriia bacterium]
MNDNFSKTNKKTNNVDDISFLSTEVMLDIATITFQEMYGEEDEFIEE